MSPMKIPNFLIDRAIIPGFNHIINGSFDIWQRGTIQTLIAGYGSDDCWRNSHLGGTKTHSRQAFLSGETFPDGTLCPKFYSRTVVNSVAGVDNYCHKYQHIEDVKILAGKRGVLTFYAKADSPKLIAIEASQYFGAGGSPSPSTLGFSVQKIQLTTTWKKYKLYIDFPSVSGKILGTNSADSRVIVFWFDAGTSFNSRTNSLGHQSGTFDIACVSLMEGSVDSPIRPRSRKEELLLCQRYYEEFTSHMFKPALLWNFGGVRVVHKFRVEKRVNPVVGYYSDYTKTVYGQMVTNKGTVVTSGNITFPEVSTKVLFYHNANNVLNAAGDYASLYITVDASI